MHTNIIKPFTNNHHSIILVLPLTHSRDGIRNPKQGRKRPLSTVVFLCLLFSNTGLIRIHSFMVGCIEQPLKRLAAALRGISNLIQPTAQRFETKSGGLNSSKELNHE